MKNEFWQALIGGGAALSFQTQRSALQNLGRDLPMVDRELRRRAQDNRKGSNPMRSTDYACR
jgi:hypothetical protein